MKNLIAFTFLLLFTVPVFAQKKIDGFLGVKFGDSPTQVITALKSRGIVVQSGAVVNGKMILKNVTLGDSTARTLEISFFKGKAYEGSFFFEADDKNFVEYYNEIKDAVDLQYGKGNSKKFFKFPYKENDGFEASAVKGGSAIYSTTWLDKSKPTKNTINLSITQQLKIKLTYKATGIGPSDL
jgi:hypothetical protein